MNVAITGPPMAGKSTLFHALTGQVVPIGVATPAGGPRHLGVVKLPDPRLDWLESLYTARKKTPLAIELVDTPGLPPGNVKGKAELVATLREAEGLLAVLPVFGASRESPAAAVRAFREDLALADLEVVEGRIERLGKKPPSRVDAPHVAWELDLLHRLREALENAAGIEDVLRNSEEEKAVRGFRLLTRKPFVLVVNGAESPSPDEAAAAAEAIALADGGVHLAAPFEADLRSFDPAERLAFLAEAGRGRPGCEDLMDALLRGLGLHVFFTAGEKEVRAWPLRAGATAAEAAGTIHSDMERGFIRAETIALEDLQALGSEKEAKAHGKLRLEGRDYVVKDGDILFIRFQA